MLHYIVLLAETSQIFCNCSMFVVVYTLCFVRSLFFAKSAWTEFIFDAVAYWVTKKITQIPRNMARLLPHAFCFVLYHKCFMLPGALSSNSGSVLLRNSTIYYHSNNHRKDKVLSRNYAQFLSEDLLGRNYGK